MIPILLVQVYVRYVTWLTGEVQRSRRRPGTLAYYVRQLQPLLADLGSVPVVELKPIHLSNHTQTWHRVQAAQRLLNWAVQQEVLACNPWAKIQKPSAGQRTRVLSGEQWALFLDHSGPELRRFLTFQRLTLARPGEVRNLVWGDLVSGEDGLIGFRLEEFKSKGRRTDGVAIRFLVLNVKAVELVVGLGVEGRPPDAPVFLNTRGKAWTTTALRQAVKRAVLRAGLPDDVVAYTVRHTAATEATRRGVRDRVLADLMGHTTTRTTARYQHLNPADLRGAIEAATG